MARTISTGAAFLLCLGAVWSNGAVAQTSLARTSSFAYDPASGLLTQEVVEPNTTALRLETDYVYDAFGNKTSVQVSGVDITTRSSTVTFDARGQFATAKHQCAGRGRRQRGALEVPAVPIVLMVLRRDRR
jgi:hypothetical protein